MKDGLVNTDPELIIPDNSQKLAQLRSELQQLAEELGFDLENFDFSIKTELEFLSRKLKTAKKTISLKSYPEKNR